MVPELAAEQRFIAFKIIHDADEPSCGSRHRTNDGGKKDAPSMKSVSALHCARGAYDSLPRLAPPLDNQPGATQRVTSGARTIPFSCEGASPYTWLNRT